MRESSKHFERRVSSEVPLIAKNGGGTVAVSAKNVRVARGSFKVRGETELVLCQLG